MLVGISYYINSIIMTKYIQEISVFENLKCKYKKLNLIFNHLVPTILIKIMPRHQTDVDEIVMLLLVLIGVMP